MTTVLAPLGQRIASLRQTSGWTQADLAQRIAASRVAVSHFEMGLATPSERTVILLAGLFKVEALELVAGTDYADAKRERLPMSTLRHTEADLQLALLERDLEWLARIASAATRAKLAADTIANWGPRLQQLQDQAEPADEARLAAAGKRLQAALTGALSK